MKNIALGIGIMVKILNIILNVTKSLKKDSFKLNLMSKKGKLSMLKSLAISLEKEMSMN